MKEQILSITLGLKHLRTNGISEVRGVACVQGEGETEEQKQSQETLASVCSE